MLTSACKKSTLLFLSIIFSCAVFSQSFPSTADSIKTILCRKWDMDHAEMMGMKLMKGQGAPDMMITFAPDFTYTSSSSDSKSAKGKWEIDNKNKKIKLSNNGKLILTIFSLTPNEMQAKLPPLNKEDEKEAENMVLFLKPKS